MSNGPFPLFLDDLRASTLGWPAEDRWAYLCLLHAMWKNGGWIADDSRAIREASDLLSTRKWQAKVELLRSKCDSEQRLIGDTLAVVLTHRRIKAEMEKAKRIRDARAAAGQRGGQANALANGKQTPEQPSEQLPQQEASKPQKPPSPSPSQEGSVADATGAAAPSEAPPVKPSAEIDLIGEMPADLRRSPPPKAADRIWGPLREALGFGDGDRSFIGRLIRDHGEDAVCAAMAKAAEAPPADPKSWLKAHLGGTRHGARNQHPSGFGNPFLAALAGSEGPDRGA